MADRKISDLTALTAPAAGDYLPIVDISEVAAASKNKRITIEELFRGVPLGTAAAPSIAIEGDENTGIYSPGADQLAISTGGTGRLFVDASGNVGIGAAPSAYKSSYTGFDIRTGSLFSAAGVGLVSLASNVYYNNSNQFIYKETDGATLYQGYSGVHTFHTAGSGTAGTVATLTEAGSGTAGTVATLTERMRITSAGNVGIGITSPLFPLDVNGVIYTRGRGSTFGVLFDDWRIYNSTSPGALVFDNGTERARIDSSGRLGLGTSSPSGLLTLAWSSSTGINSGLIGQVTNAAGANNGYRIGLRTSSDSTNWCSIDQVFTNLGVNADTYIAFTTTNASNSAAERMRLTSTGLGIGTTSPLYPLHVEKNQEDLLALVNTGVVTYRFQVKTDASLNVPASTAPAGF